MVFRISIQNNKGPAVAGDVFADACFELPIESEAELFDDEGRVRDINSFALRYLAPAFAHALENMREVEKARQFGESCG